MHKIIGVKIFDSNYFHSKNRTAEIIYRTRGSRINRIIHDYKKGLSQEDNHLPATAPSHKNLDEIQSGFIPTIVIAIILHLVVIGALSWFIIGRIV